VSACCWRWWRQGLVGDNALRRGMRQKPHVVVERWVHESIAAGRRLAEIDYCPPELRRTLTSDTQGSVSSMFAAMRAESPVETFQGGTLSDLSGPLAPQAKKMPLAKTTESDPNFLNQYYAMSRLHMIGEYRAKMQTFVDDLQSVYCRRLWGEGHSRDFPCCNVLPTPSELALVKPVTKGTSSAAVLASKLGRQALVSVWDEEAVQSPPGDEYSGAASPLFDEDEDAVERAMSVVHRAEGEGLAGAELRAPQDARTPLLLYPAPPSGSGSLPNRVVVLVDMDCFFVSVRRAVDPSLVGKPVAVAHCPPEAGASGSSKVGSTGEGEVASCSYEARACGVRAGFRVKDAREACRAAGLELCVEPYDFERIEATARVVYELFCRYSRRVQAQSIDEAYLDLTGCRDPERLVDALRRDIREHTGCSASAGIARSKLLAKLACHAAKRASQGDSQLLLPDDDRAVDEFLLKLRAHELPGVGYASNRLLKANGILTVADVRAQSLGSLQKLLGEESGLKLMETACGVDPKEEAVGMRKPRQSVGLQVYWGCRFSTLERAEAWIRETLSEEVSHRLARVGASEAGLQELSLGLPAETSRDVRAGDPVSLRGSRVTLTVLEAKPDAASHWAKVNGHGACFTHSSSLQLPGPSCDTCTIAEAAVGLFRQLGVAAVKIRGLGLQVSELTGPGGAPRGGPKSVDSSASMMRTFLARGKTPRVGPSIQSPPHEDADQFHEDADQFHEDADQRRGGMLGPLAVARSVSEVIELDSDSEVSGSPRAKRVKLSESTGSVIEIVSEEEEHSVSLNPMSWSQVDPDILAQIPASMQLEVRQSLGRRHVAPPLPAASATKPRRGKRPGLVVTDAHRDIAVMVQAHDPGFVPRDVDPDVWASLPLEERKEILLQLNRKAIKTKSAIDRRAFLQGSLAVHPPSVSAKALEVVDRTPPRPDQSVAKAGGVQPVAVSVEEGPSDSEEAASGPLVRLAQSPVLSIPATFQALYECVFLRLNESQRSDEAEAKWLALVCLHLAATQREEHLVRLLGRVAMWSEGNPRWGGIVAYVYERVSDAMEWEWGHSLEAPGVKRLLGRSLGIASQH
jgi:nucleotidyltransferase/DNA polymerase involved in DNA repair